MAVTSDRQTFAMARMSAVVAAITWVCLLLPVGLPLLILLVGPYDRVKPLVAAALFAGVVVLYALIWGLWRPERFEVDAGGLWIRFPWRARHIPAEEIASARVVAKKELGVALRICGAGGLFGGFGLHWSSRVGLMDLYASRGDSLVRIDRHGRRPIVLTPDRPDEFVAALTSVAPEA